MKNKVKKNKKHMNTHPVTDFLVIFKIWNPDATRKMPNQSAEC